MANIPLWHAKGDWFDVCKCNIPCPCTFAQAPTFGDCDGVLAWHVREGRYGDVVLDGLNVLALGAFKGNIWAGAKITLGIFIDSRADDRQRDALQTIFGGQAGGWPGQFAQTIAEVRGIEVAPIEFEVASDLAYWRAAVPNKVQARGEVLTGPTMLPGQRPQTHNPPVVRPARMASRPGAWPPSTRPTGSVSSGAAPVSRASTYRSTGPAPGSEPTG